MQTRKLFAATVAAGAALLSLNGCATDSVAAPHYDQFVYCHKRANDAYEITRARDEGATASVLAAQIHQSNESPTSKSLAFNALSLSGLGQGPRLVAHTIYVNCMHMSIPADQQGPGKPAPSSQSAACPKGYTCTKNPH